jgi:hypothetical protein
VPFGPLSKLERGDFLPLSAADLRADRIEDIYKRKEKAAKIEEMSQV